MNYKFDFRKKVALLSMALGTIPAAVQEAVDNSLSRHDFFYAGQSKKMRMFIVKEGQVTWNPVAT